MHGVTTKIEKKIKIYLQKTRWGHGLDVCGSGWGQVAGACECGNEHLGCM